jgi:Thioredoxin
MPTYVDLTNINEISHVPNFFHKVTSVAWCLSFPLDICPMTTILEHAWENGVDFISFLNHVKSLHQLDRVTGNIQTAELLAYSKLNEKRMDRILKHGKCNATSEVKKSKRWLVITEGWCGDSAQITPYLYLFSQQNDAEIRVVLRDDNPAVMDLFLTHGSRSIPIIVMLDDHNQVVAQWGPRPLVLSDLVKGWKEQGLTKEEFNPLIHKWYADDKGNSCIQEWEALLR